MADSRKRGAVSRARHLPTRLVMTDVLPLPVHMGVLPQGPLIREHLATPVHGAQVACNRAGGRACQRLWNPTDPYLLREREGAGGNERSRGWMQGRMLE